MGTSQGSSVHLATVTVFSCDECGGGLILYSMISDSPMHRGLSRKLDSETTRQPSSSGSSGTRGVEHVQTIALKLVIVTVLTNTDTTLMTLLVCMQLNTIYYYVYPRPGLWPPDSLWWNLECSMHVIYVNCRFKLYRAVQYSHTLQTFKNIYPCFHPRGRTLIT